MYTKQIPKDNINDKYICGKNEPIIADVLPS